MQRLPRRVYGLAWRRGPVLVIDYIVFENPYRKMSAEKKSFALAEDEWQVILDSLSNTIFNEELSEDARKKAKELFVRLQKELPRK